MSKPADTMQSLETHFDTAFSAPEGIKKLRELILALAMRGKLVPQDPNDQPASELLKEIEAERTRLVKAGKIKASKPLPAIKPEEVPYELPIGWEWGRFGEIAIIERGGSPRPINAFLTDDPDGFNWIKIGDTDQGGKYITSTKEKIRPEGLTKTRMVYPGDFLLTNSMSYGRPYITQIEGCIHDGWLRISPPGSLDKDYLYHLLSSSFMRKMFETAAAGAVVLNLNSNKVRELPMPLPPLAEQHRIVAKIDQLMARCDELEKLRTEHGQKRIAARTAVLNRLLTATEGEAFGEAWDFITQNFEELYSVKENVAELRKAILQLAVMGKLVPQNANDQPASKLLKEIDAEKKRLVKEGKIKQPKPLPAIKPEEVPYELPKVWEWVRIQECYYPIGSRCNQIQTKDYRDSGLFPVVDQGKSFIAGFCDDEAKALKISTPVIVFGDHTKNIKYVDFDFIIGADGVKILNPYKLIDSRFLFYVINSYDLADRGYARHFKVLNEKLVPIPPLAEQQRIVAKIDQLMALCDELEKQIDAASGKQNALLNAVMAQV